MKKTIILILIMLLTLGIGMVGVYADNESNCDVELIPPDSFVRIFFNKAFIKQLFPAPVKPNKIKLSVFTFGILSLILLKISSCLFLINNLY